MTKLCFFNFYHNGDLYHSKPFVREVIKHLGKEKVLYAHNKDHRVIQDLDIQSVRLQGLSDKIKIFKPKDPDMMFVNTWIGSYFDKYTGECTLNFNMKMWTDIYNDINTTFKKKMVLSPVEKYLPYVDYSKYDMNSTLAYLEQNKQKKVMFCNGRALAGQCDYNGDMGEIIRPLALRNLDKTFIVTHQINHDQPNIISTSQITQIPQCDLPQISYLARACDLIVGRNSGPFCFASTGESLNDPSKTFYAFGTRDTDCFTHGIPVKSKYIFEKYQDQTQLFRSIEELVSKI